MKLKVLRDLSNSCKLTLPDLLRYASQRVYAFLTHLLMLDQKLLPLFQDFIGLEFYKNKIMHKSWFHLLVGHEVLTHEKLKETLLSYKDEQGQQIFSLQGIKRSLYFLFAKIAGTSHLLASAKRATFKLVMKVFGFENE